MAQSGSPAQSGAQSGGSARDASSDGPDQRPVLPPPPADLGEAEQAKREAEEARRAEREAKAHERDRVRQERQAAKEAKAQEKADAKAAARERGAADAKQRQDGVPVAQATRGAKTPATPRRTRKAQLRLVQIDAWSVMKTSFLLSIALGIVLVVAVAIIWSVLSAAGVWDSINSIVQQAVGSADGPQFDITDYVGTSRVLGFTMVVAAFDVVLITAIATLGAFLYNLSAALLGGVELTLAEDS